MSFVPVRSGNAHADLYVARRRLNDAYARDLYDLWKEKSRAVLEQVAREQPAVLVKCMTLMMPKEMKFESTQAVISGLSDEQLHAMLAELQERIAAKASEAKVINGEAAELAALPAPQPTRYRRQPKSTPERLAYAREYKRQRKAGNPNAAAAARAAAQVAKTTEEPTPTSAA